MSEDFENGNRKNEWGMGDVTPEPQPEPLETEPSVSQETEPPKISEPPKPKNNKKLVKVLAIAALCVVCVGLLGLATFGALAIANRDGMQAGSETVATESVSEAKEAYEGLALNDKPTEASAADGELTTVQAVAKALPSVVTIKVSVSVPAYYGIPNGQVTGIGSGIIMESDGHIITNAHVVESVRSIHVILDGNKEKEYEAKLVGIDRRTDLAIIKVDAEGEKLTLIPAEMGNSDQMKLGEKVLIIGTPQDVDLAGSVTQGIVSGLNRDIAAETTQYTGLLQVDAAINPGNSGGALVNGSGQIIGINSTKHIGMGAEGLGFAISINSAKPILDELMNEGRIESRYCLGFTGHEIDEETARIERIPVGIYVDALRNGSDMLHKVLVGDIITHVGGEPSPTIASVTKTLEGKKAGDSVKIKLNRYDTKTNENEDIEVTVVLIKDVDEKSEYEIMMELYSSYYDDDESSSSIAPPPESGQLASYNL